MPGLCLCMHSGEVCIACDHARLCLSALLRMFVHVNAFMNANGHARVLACIHEFALVCRVSCLEVFCGLACMCAYDSDATGCGRIMCRPRCEYVCCSTKMAVCVAPTRSPGEGRRLETTRRRCASKAFAARGQPQVEEEAPFFVAVVGLVSLAASIADVMLAADTLGVVVTQAFMAEYVIVFLERCSLPIVVGIMFCASPLPWLVQGSASGQQSSSDRQAASGSGGPPQCKAGVEDASTVAQLATRPRRLQSAKQEALDTREELPPPSRRAPRRRSATKRRTWPLEQTAPRAAETHDPGNVDGHRGAATRTRCLVATLRAVLGPPLGARGPAPPQRNHPTHPRSRWALSSRHSRRDATARQHQTESTTPCLQTCSMRGSDQFVTVCGTIGLYSRPQAASHPRPRLETWL